MQLETMTTKHRLVYLMAFLTLLIFQSAAQFNSIEVTGIYPTILPRADGEIAVAYDKANDTILLMGGNQNGKQFITFKDNTFVARGFSYNSVCAISGTGQYYSQISSTLWMICSQDNNLITLNTNTWKFNNPSIDIPLAVFTGACLASLDIGSNQYLFVVGGSNQLYQPIDEVQVYDVASSQWLPQANIPKMNKNRKDFSCIVHNNKLYAIGGRYSCTQLVESLYVGSINNIYIGIETWTYTENTLSIGMSNTRAVAYGDDIIVIPGWSRFTLYPTNINIINTLTNTISVGGRVKGGFLGTTGIIVNQVLYMFGGYNENIGGYLSTYQYLNLWNLPKTMSPTYITQTPTEFSTYDPKIDPKIDDPKLDDTNTDRALHPIHQLIIWVVASTILIVILCFIVSQIKKKRIDDKDIFHHVEVGHGMEKLEKRNNIKNRNKTLTFSEGNIAASKHIVPSAPPEEQIEMDEFHNQIEGH